MKLRIFVRWFSFLLYLNARFCFRTCSCRDSISVSLLLSIFCSLCSLGHNFIVTSDVISTFSPVIFNTLIEHVYSSGVTRQFLINIPDLASSDLTPILIYSHMIFICNRSRYRFAAGDQCYFPVRVKFQSYPVNW